MDSDSGGPVCQQNPEREHVAKYVLAQIVFFYHKLYIVIISDFREVTATSVTRHYKISLSFILKLSVPLDAKK